MLVIPGGGLASALDLWLMSWPAPHPGGLVNQNRPGPRPAGSPLGLFGRKFGFFFKQAETPVLLLGSKTTSI